MPEQSKFNQFPILLPPGTDYSKQSIAVPGTERPGQSGEFLENLVILFSFIYFLAWTLERFCYRSHDTREPVLILASIPFIGHLIRLARLRSQYFTKLRYGYPSFPCLLPRCVSEEGVTPDYLLHKVESWAAALRIDCQQRCLVVCEDSHVSVHSV